MKFEFVTRDAQLDGLYEAMQSTPWIAFDTEFVSEYTYYPELCLIQVATQDGLWVVDSLELSDVRGFWQSLCQGDHLTIVHAGREELLFCHRAVQAAPKNWFDAQLAAGMAGLEFPASYGKIVLRLLDQRLAKGETRTDWRRRPLSRSQLEYALHDVIYLKPIHDELTRRLEQRGRLKWLEEETASWRHRVLEVDTKERWRRVSGAGSLHGQKLVIVRELWKWRESEAQRRNVHPKRVLRDDLIVELARRGQGNRDRIRAIRGMQRRDLKEHIADITQCIQAAAGMQIDSRDTPPRPELPKQADSIAQFLATALASICREQSIAPQIVGTMQDVKDLVAQHLGFRVGAQPKLLTDWRYEIAGEVLIKALDGKLSLRIRDPLSEFPVSIEQTH